MSLRHMLNSVCVSLALCSCAVQQTPAVISLVPAGDSVERTLASALAIQLNTGYHRTLKAGSHWRQIGSVPQGAVYKPYLDVFTIEGAHIHEAYLVVESAMLVGFYLPAERSYVSLNQRKSILFN